MIFFFMWANDLSTELAGVEENGLLYVLYVLWYVLCIEEIPLLYR